MILLSSILHIDLWSLASYNDVIRNILFYFNKFPRVFRGKFTYTHVRLNRNLCPIVLYMYNIKHQHTTCTALDKPTHIELVFSIDNDSSVHDSLVQCSTYFIILHCVQFDMVSSSQQLPVRSLSCPTMIKEMFNSLQYT